MKTILALIFFLSFAMEVICQIPPVDGTPQETPWVENNGFLLKTQVSATSEYSGVPFTYTIFYTIPTGVDNGTVITITDVIPAPLKVETTSDPNISISPVDDDVTTPTDVIYTVPVANMVQGTYNFQINVKFPPGTTCNGTIANNLSCMTTSGTTGALISSSNPGLCTDAVNILAVAVDNPYLVNKGCVLPYTGTGSNLLYQGVVDGVVEYTIGVVWKPDLFYSNGFGLQDLTNVVVTDILPAGAIYVPSSFYITYGDPQYNSAIIASLTITGNILSFVIPYVSYNQWLCQFYYKVHYPETSVPPDPSFPAGTIVENSASFTANSCNSTVVSNTSTTHVQLNEASYSANNYGKAVYISNPVPGCAGAYQLAVQNTGNVPLPAFTILDDPFPSQLNVKKLMFNSVHWNNCPLPFTLNINNGELILTVPNSDRYVWENTGNLSVSSIRVDLGSGLGILCAYGVSIFFTVGDNLSPGTIISNTMDVSFDPQYNIPPINSTATFTIEDYRPKICAINRVCNPLGAYLYDDVIRYKFSIQNIGSQELTGAKITDLLNPNLEYLAGSESYYYTTNYNENCSTSDPTPPAYQPPPIPEWATPWSGVTVIQSGQNIEWSIPTIEPHCDYANYCGDPSTYYYIEFNVRVKQYALAGSLPNFFTVSGGTLPLPVTSNTNYVTVNSVYGAQAEKFISVDNGVTWSKNATALPGSEVMFRLEYTNTANYPVSDIVLVDMLPMNFNATDDRMILNRASANNRGSQFELNYSTTLNSGSLPMAMVNSMPLTSNPAVSVNNDYNICLPELTYSPPGCYSVPAWQLTGTMKNVKFEFGPSISLMPQDVLTCDFKIQVPAGIPQSFIACNSFALISTGYYYIVNQSGASVLHIVDPLPAESDLGCLIAGTFTATAQGISNFHGFNISCYGGNDGIAEVFPTGGIGPYTYLWNDPAGQTTKAATGLMAGTYSVLITDFYGNWVTATCILTEPPLLVADAGPDKSICLGNSTTIGGNPTASGGVSPYVYSWSPATGLSSASDPNPVASSLVTTTYIVTVTDQNGCTATDFVTVTVNPLPVPAITGPATVCAASTGNVYTTQPGMNSYVWNVSAGGIITAGGAATDNTVTLTWNTAGAQTVSVNFNDVNDCSAFTPAVFNVTVNPRPIPVINGPSTVCVGSTGNVYCTMAGMTGYVWTVSAGGTVTAGQGTNTITVTWNTAGAQSVSVNYNNTFGCPASTPTVYPVTVNLLPVPTITGSTPVCVNSTGNIYTTQPGMTGYVWAVSAGGVITAGAGTSAITVTWNTAGAQTVSVNYNDVNDCSAFTPAVFNVTVNPLPVASITVSADFNFCNGITLTAHSSTSEGTYQWSNNETEQSIYLSVDDDPPGLYTVYVADLNGCQSVLPASYLYAPQDVGSSYTIIGFKECQIGPGNDVLNGSVGLTGINKMAHFKQNSKVNGPGSFVKAQNINAHPTAVILQKIYQPANPTLPIMLYNTSTGINGTIVVPMNTTTTINTTYVNLDIKENCNVTITGDVYGKIEVDQGCTITFTAAEINLVALEIKNVPNPAPIQIIFTQDAILKVRDNVYVPKYTTVNPDENNVVFYIGEETGPVTGDIGVSDEGTEFNASAYVPRGVIHTFEDNSTTNTGFMTGQFIAEKVISSGKNITWNWRSCDPVPPASHPIATGSSSEESQAVLPAGSSFTIGSSSEESQADLPAGSSFTIYPVPNDGRFIASIVYPAEEPFIVKVYNDLGVKVHESGTILVKGKVEHYVDLQSAPVGLYVVVFEGPFKHIIKKVLIMN